MAKQELQSLIKQLQDKKTQDEQKKWQEEQAKGVMTELQKEQTKSLQPVLEGMAKVMTDKMSEEFSKAISKIKVDAPQMPEVKIPEIKMPDYPVFRVPEPKVTVNFDASKIRVPEVVMPDMMDVRGMVKLDGVDFEHPLPVTLRDKEGKPVDLASWTTSVIGGGGKADHFTVKGITSTVGVVNINPDGTATAGSNVVVSEIFGTAGANVINPDGRMKVELPTGSSGLTDTELRASSVPVAQISDAIWSTQVVSIFGSTITSLLNGDNRIPVSVETGGSGLTDAELRASSVPVAQASGVVWSTEVTNTLTVSGSLTSTGAYLLNGDGTYRSSLPIEDGGGSITVDGTFWQATQPVSGTVTANLGTIADVATQTTLSAINAKLVTGTDIGDVTINNASGASAVNIQDGGNSLTVDGTVAVSGVTGTIGVNIVDSSGIAYSTTNPVPVDDAGGSLTIDGTVAVSGLTGSIVVIGEIVSDAADTGNAPIKIGGIARTENPTAVSGGDRVSMSMDDLGRQITRPVQVRDLISTAYVSKATGSTFGTETTLFAGATSTYHDLIYVLASNDSTAAIGVDIRGTTAGNILMHLEIPANSTTGLSLPVPLPAGDVGASWTIDLPDVTGTNVYVSALFSKEI